MHSQEWQLCSPDGERRTISTGFIILGIFFIYLLLRCVAWKNTVILEDTDSLSYLETIQVFLTFNLQNIINLSPDSTPFYPLFGALFSLPGWSVETGARLCSLFFTCLLFVTIVGIGKQIGKPLEVALGLLILSFSPVLISLSFAVLTEPSYIATVYLGLWLFWIQYNKPKLWTAGLLGLIFGLAFLNRLEGILYLVIIPFFQGVYVFREGNNGYRFKHLIAWSLMFFICFSLLAIPQILRVSYKMGGFAINGRQIWSLVLNNPDGKSYNEKLFGLDFSPSQYNIEYIQSHPHVLNQFTSKPGPQDYIKTVVSNFTELCQDKLGILIGPLGFIFFAFGILALHQSGKRFEVFLILAFIGFGLVAPLLHNVVLRHIAVIAPVMFLTEGIGIVYCARSLLAGSEKCFANKNILSLLFLFLLIGISAYPLLFSIMRPPHYNNEYSPAELKKPIAIVKQIEQNELMRTPVIASQRGYLAYFAEGKQIYLPYTNYEGLVKYCHLNNVDFLYLQHKRVRDFPFLQAFLENDTHTDFSLLYAGVDGHGQKVELYLFQKAKRTSLGSYQK